MATNKTKNLISTLWALLRPMTYMLLLIYLLFGISYGNAVTGENKLLTLSSTLRFILVSIAIGFWYISGTALNDYADYEIDKINLKDDKQRPLIIGIASKDLLLKVAVFCSFTSLLLSALIFNLVIFILFFVMVLLNVAYSIKPIQISRRGGLAPLLLPLGYIVLTVSSGMIISNTPLNTSSFLVIVGMYLHFMSRIVLKDHRDVKGDETAGKKTLILQYGNVLVSYLSLMLFILSTFILVYATWEYLNSAIIFIVLMASSASTFLYQLSQQNKWKQQKLAITLYGRICTGLIVVFILSFNATILNLTKIESTVIFTITVTYTFLSLIDIKNFQSRQNN